ncbi:MAG: AraC family transcriptional regulator [Oscillospiraceae bacterium]|jgi:AraC-like DNA-binding protein|nr:AraC family transcriptional regulator [Oscillospiraceae bacterium]
MDFQTAFQREEQPPLSHLSCHAYYGKTESYPRHCHTFYEISYIIHGSRMETINQDRYEAGRDSLLFIPPLAIHGLSNLTNVEDVVIQFDHLFLRNASELFGNKDMLSPGADYGGCFDMSHSTRARQIILEIWELCHKRDALTQNEDAPVLKRLSIDISLNSLCLQLIALLLNEGKLQIGTKGAQYPDVINLNSLIQELMAHPEKTISMREASRTAGMSYTHFSRFFEKATGFHYSALRGLLRIRRAEELLLTTSMPISEVSSTVGIATVSYFTRLFKQINGCSPSAYRKQYRLRP